MSLIPEERVPETKLTFLWRQLTPPAADVSRGKGKMNVMGQSQGGRADHAVGVASFMFTALQARSAIAGVKPALPLNTHN